MSTPKIGVMLPAALVEQARHVAARQGTSAEAWFERTIERALEGSTEFVSPRQGDVEMPERVNGDRLERRLHRIESRFDLFNQLLSRMQRVEDRLDLLD